MALQVMEGTVRAWEKGRFPANEATRERVVAYLDSLLTERIRKVEENMPMHGNSHDLAGGVAIPLVQHLPAPGGDIQGTEGNFVMVFGMTSENVKNCVAYNVEGNEFAPFAPDGSMIVLDREMNPQPGAVVAVRVGEVDRIGRYEVYASGPRAVVDPLTGASVPADTIIGVVIQVVTYPSRCAMEVAGQEVA